MYYNLYMILIHISNVKDTFRCPIILKHNQSALEITAKKANDVYSLLSLTNLKREEIYFLSSHRWLRRLYVLLRLRLCPFILWETGNKIYIWEQFLRELLQFGGYKTGPPQPRTPLSSMQSAPQKSVQLDKRSIYIIFGSTKPRHYRYVARF